MTSPRTTAASLPTLNITGRTAPPTDWDRRTLPDMPGIGWYKPISRQAKMPMSPALVRARRSGAAGSFVKRVGPAVGVLLLTAGRCLAQTEPQTFIADHCIECHNS